MLSFVASDAVHSYSIANPRQRAITSSLVEKLIIDCCLPISIVENASFRSFLSTLDSKYSPPCRQTITYSLLPKMLTTKKDHIKALLGRCPDVSLTTDIWTDRRSHAFLAITAHGFVDGASQRMLLSFKAFAGSHTGERISEAIADVIDEHELQNKVRYIVTDNASNMRKAIDVMFSIQDDVPASNVDVQEDGQSTVDDPSLWQDIADINIETVVGRDLEHISCFAHSLQLVVRDGLDTISSGRPFMSKCSKIANIVHQSALFRSEFEKVMGQGKSIPATNNTRWNSTFKQLHSFVSLDITALNKVLCDTNHQNLTLTPKDVAQLKELVQILTPFSEATDLTQGDQTVTISCVVPTILSLKAKLEVAVQSPGSFSSLVKTLLVSLCDRFAGIFQLLGIERAAELGLHFNRLKFDSNIFIMAPALDPFYAYHWLQDYPGTDEAREAMRCKINGECIAHLETLNIIEYGCETLCTERFLSTIYNKWESGKSFFFIGWLEVSRLVNLRQVLFIKHCMLSSNSTNVSIMQYYTRGREYLSMQKLYGLHSVACLISVWYFCQS